MNNTIAPPTLEELNERIVAIEDLRNTWRDLPSKTPFDLELYCLYAVRDGVEKGARKRSPYWTCCECDAPLSCAVCGVEQPDDSKYFEGQARDAAQSPWMDIETAPKDGTKIDVWADPPPFITALKNGGTKEEAIFALERMWEEQCGLRSALEELTSEVAPTTKSENRLSQRLGCALLRARRVLASLDDRYGGDL